MEPPHGIWNPLKLKLDCPQIETLLQIYWLLTNILLIIQCPWYQQGGFQDLWHTIWYARVFHILLYDMEPQVYHGVCNKYACWISLLFPYIRHSMGFYILSYAILSYPFIWYGTLDILSVCNKYACQIFLLFPCTSHTRGSISNYMLSY